MTDLIGYVKSEIGRSDAANFGEGENSLLSDLARCSVRFSIVLENHVWVGVRSRHLFFFGLSEV